MLTKKPKPDSIIYIKIQEFRDSKYVASKAITVYNATASRIAKVVAAALRAAEEVS